MAYLVPDDLSRLALAGASEPELETLAFLKERLPAQYVVFHGVHWSRAYEARTAFGEIDFVVVNLAGEAMLIEQKNGAMEETAGGLVKNYATGGSKAPADQARRAVDQVRGKFRDVNGPDAAFRLDYLVYCPDHRIRSLNAAGLDADRIVDATHRDSLAERIEAVLGPGRDDEEKRDQVLAFFRQTFDLVADIHAHKSSQDRSYTRLTRALGEVVANIEMAPLRLRVRGVAGCGKTQVVERLYADAVARGRRPLVLCYTRPLKERLAAALGAGGKVQTWNGLCDEFLISRGHKLDYDRMNKEPGFWREVADLVIGEEVPGAWKFDTLIVDEGQDFEQTWWEILTLFQAPDCDVIWLEDPDQNLFGKQPVTLDGFVGYRSRDNYRTPETISRFIQKNLPFEFRCANSLPGLGVGLNFYEAPEDQIAIVDRTVSALLDKGFTYDDIVVLTCRGIGSSVLSDRNGVGIHSLCRFTGEYAPDGSQIWTEGKLRFESINRFKGQQAPAVILIDVDPSDVPDRLERNQRLLYCGMTRATIRLELVARKGNSSLASFNA